MSFYLPSNREYQRVKRIKQSQSRLDPNYDTFAVLFSDEFGFPPLAVSTSLTTQEG